MNNLKTRIQNIKLKKHIKNKNEEKNEKKI